MAVIEIYTKPGCPYCDRAMALLDHKKAPYKEIVASNDPDLRREMNARANGRNTFPQIFIDGLHVGGCDDLFALDSRGGLDPLLEGAA
ncbi:MAG: glutaredoxin 3 [Asticcacaulis sp.]